MPETDDEQTCPRSLTYLFSGLRILSFNPCSARDFESSVDSIQRTRMPSAVVPVSMKPARLMTHVCFLGNALDCRLGTPLSRSNRRR